MEIIKFKLWQYVEDSGKAKLIRKGNFWIPVHRLLWEKSEYDAIPGFDCISIVTPTLTS